MTEEAIAQGLLMAINGAARSIGHANADPQWVIDCRLMEGSSLGRLEPDRAIPMEREVEDLFAERFRVASGRVAIAAVTIAAFSTPAVCAEATHPPAFDQIHVECGAFRRGPDGQWSTVRSTTVTIPHPDEAPQRILLGPVNSILIYQPAGMPLVKVLDLKCGM